MKKTLFSLVALFITTIVFAYDVEIGGIYYNLNHETKTAEVTYQEKYSEMNYIYVTTLNIPSSVSYNNEIYNVTSIGGAAFSSCSSLRYLTIPNSVISIENYAFFGCHPLTEIVIPHSVISIGNYAFFGCSSLASISLPNSVTSIGHYAFQACTSLTSVTIGNGIISISELAFLGCISLTSFEILAQTPPTIYENTFHEVPLSVEIKVPCSAMVDYQVADYWKDFTNYEGILSAIIVLSNDETMGSAEIIKQATCEDVEAQIEAKPFGGYEFVKWSDDNTENPRTIHVTNDTTITAIFQVALPTLVENANDLQHKIYITNNTIYIENIDNNYQIYTATGQLIYNGNAMTISLPRGIYFITINGEIEKIVI